MLLPSGRIRTSFSIVGNTPCNFFNFSFRIISKRLDGDSINWSNLIIYTVVAHPFASNAPAHQQLKFAEILLLGTVVVRIKILFFMVIVSLNRDKRSTKRAF